MRCIKKKKKKMNVDENSKNENEIIKLKYTFRYRVVKTILFHCAYLSLGLICELYSVTFEDLRILLDINYQQSSNLFIIKVIGYVASIPLIGFIIDSYLNYADLLTSLALLGLALRKCFSCI